MSKNKTLIIIVIIAVLVISGGVIGYFVLVKNYLASTITQKTPEQISSKEISKQTSVQSVQEQLSPSSTENPEVSPSGWIKYIDSQNRFSFFYSPTFGTPSQGTNNDFGDRVVAVRFSEFSSGMHNGQIILGGEAVLTKGFVFVDIQALGGLYDSITLEVFPDTLRNNIFLNLPALTVANFCGEIAKEQHLDLSKPVFASLSQQQKDAIINTDKTRNINPKVIRCDIIGDIVTFQKEATFKLGQVEARQNIYGAIRFLKSPFSSFQIIRVTTEAPTKEMLSDITSVVKSFK